LKKTKQKQRQQQPQVLNEPKEPDIIRSSLLQSKHDGVCVVSCVAKKATTKQKQMVLGFEKSEAKGLLSYALRTTNQQQPTTKYTAIEVLEKAIDNLKPRIEMISSRRGGSVLLKPKILYNEYRSISKAIRWVLEDCYKNRKGISMIKRLSKSLLDCYSNVGYCIRKKEELYKLAVVNAAFTRKPQEIVDVTKGVNSPF
jgi:small subunit ribosomal protein S7